METGGRQWQCGSVAVIVDVVTCQTCRCELRRTAAMVRRGTRHHHGSCTAEASRDNLRATGRLKWHMYKMRMAARKTRMRRLRNRLAVVAPDVQPNQAAALWMAGYKAGYEAKRRVMREP